MIISMLIPLLFSAAWSKYLADGAVLPSHTSFIYLLIYLFILDSV